MNIIITGASSGVGEHLAYRLINQSHRVIITGRSEDRLKKVTEKLNQNNTEGHYIVGELDTIEGAQHVIAKIRELVSTVDLLVLNAGVGAFGMIEDLSLQDYESVFNTNVRHVFMILNEFVPLMKEQKKGQIIITSSNLGINTIARGSVYCASKFAVQGMVGSLRQELRGTGVKLATINPGQIDTPWFGDHDPNTKRTDRLDVEEVVDAFMTVINQGTYSNIDKIHLLPNY